MVIQINVPAATIQTLNDKLKDSTNIHDGVTQLEVLLATINGGQASAEVDVYVNSVSQTVTNGGGGNSANYNLL
jgi:hypothetical protein